MANIGRFEDNAIYNEDAYKAILDIPDNSIDLIVTDPPYDIPHIDMSGGIFKNRKDKYTDELADNDLCVGINDEMLRQFIRVCKKTNAYIWCNKLLVPKIVDFYILKRGCLFEIIVWHKTDPVPLTNNKYLNDTEYCIYVKEKGIPLNTTYKTASTHYEQTINKKDKERFDHPTIKPLNIIRNLILNSSNEGDLVLDPFMGSGTTAVACQETGRRYLGFELSQKWYKVATDRIQGITANGDVSFLSMLD